MLNCPCVTDENTKLPPHTVNKAIRRELPQNESGEGRKAEASRDIFWRAEVGSAVQNFLIIWGTSGINGTVIHRKVKLTGTSGSLWSNLLLKTRLISTSGRLCRDLPCYWGKSAHGWLW